MPPVANKLKKLETLSENIRSLLNSKVNCDVILQVKNRKFSAHKAILIARSSVFAAMFCSDHIKKYSRLMEVVKFPDCDPKAFHYFLQFLYSGKLENIPFSIAFNLYNIARKFDVRDLEDFCFHTMKIGLTENNVCDVIMLAEKHGEGKLLSEAVYFFSKNANKVMVTDAWNNIRENNWSLADRLIKMMQRV